MKIVGILFICLASFSLNAKTLYCSHSELCRLATLIANENHLKTIQVENLVQISGDPHEYEPGTTQIKSLLTAPILLTGPAELNPWIKKINFQRSKNKELKTISLLFKNNHLGYYPKASAEALSHFWLYPKIYCSFKEQLEAELKNLGESIVIKKCDPTIVENELSTILAKINKPIILTHDALLPLLNTLAPSKNIVAIKGSGHHEEASADSIKKLYKALEAPSAVWIIEKSINIPSNIIGRVRSSDVVIKLDTANSSEMSDFSVLSNLVKGLREIGAKQ